MIRLLVGLVIGVIAGLMWAPKRGTEMREEASAKARKLYDTGMQTYETQSGKVRRLIDENQGSIDKASDDIMNKIEETKSKVIELVRKAEEKAEEDSAASDAPEVADIKGKKSDSDASANS